MSLCKGRVRVSVGFLLLVAWFVQANGWGLLLTVMGAAAVHELGHWLALGLLGARVIGLRLTVFGAEMETAWDRLSYGAELTAVLAGPAANLVWGLVLASLGKAWFEAAGAHLVLCSFNLLRGRPLDGGRALELAVSWAAGPAAGERVARWVGVFASMGISAGLCWLLWRTGGSLWLLPAAIGTFASGFREIFPENYAKKVK